MQKPKANDSANPKSMALIIVTAYKPVYTIYPNRQHQNRQIKMNPIFFITYVYCYNKR